MNSSVDRLYMKRQVGGRGLISVEECVRAEELGLCEYVAGSDEWMLKVVGAQLEAEAEPKLDFKKRMAEERKVRLMGKNLHGKFFKETKDVADERSWQWLRRGSLYKTTEGYVCCCTGECFDNAQRQCNSSEGWWQRQVQNVRRLC